MTDRAFQQRLGLRQGIIKAGALVQFGFVQRLSIHQKFGGFAAVGAHGGQLAGDAGGASNG
ncbi:MAG: hypothetical protein ACTHKU_05865 [Verrucomicrobiota bacterium]